MAARKMANPSVPTAGATPWSSISATPIQSLPDALGEGERGHEHADEERPSLAPGRERRGRAVAAAARSSGGRGRG